MLRFTQVISSKTQKEDLMKSFLNLSMVFALYTTLAITFLMPTQTKAQCVTILGSKHCLDDYDPTKLIPGSKEFVEKAWGEAGAVGYQAAAETMQAKNGRDQQLDDFQKKYLRVRFGDLVDKVGIVYGAKMMDEWCAMGKCTRTDSAAQTYCNRIYVKDQYSPGDVNQLMLLAHELRHSEQCRETGGEGKFGFHYFREFKRANQNYENNKMEVDARRAADDFAAKYYAGELLPRGGSLVSYHSGCDGNPLNPACVAAIYRACNAKGSGGGFGQEAAGGVIGVACLNTAWYGGISIAELRGHHSDCDNNGKSQTASCAAAVHRACASRNGNAGIVQEVGSNGFGVACFNAKWYGGISINELRSHHSDCDSVGKSRTSSCTAAVARACKKRGAGGGVIQEVGNDGFGVACFDNQSYENIPVR